jgi:putative holliday junction resolvase
MSPDDPTVAPASPSDAPRRGVRLGVDVGDVRIGVARCDPGGSLATPVETVRRGPGDLARLVALVVEEGAIEVVVGLPTSLSGREGPAAAKAREFALSLAGALAASGAETTGGDSGERGVGVPVRLVDERLTTVSAERVLREHGLKGAKRRAVVDQAAAVAILQHAIDTERSTGRPAGQEVGQTRE